MDKLLTLQSNYDRSDLIIVALAAISLTFVVSLVRTARKRGLRDIPGPRLARISNLYLAKQVPKLELHRLFNELHGKYGTFVRVGPNKVSIADPAYLPVIYGINSKFNKAPFYSVFTSLHKGTTMENLFSARDTTWHKRIKSAVAPAYSLSYLRHLEPLVDEVSEIFLAAMHDLAGQSIDFGEWLQWYAFDVIGNITFSQMFGFVKERGDPRQVLPALEVGQIYSTLLAQFPALHFWLLGNPLVYDLANKIPAIGRKNPIALFDEMIEQGLQNPKMTDTTTDKADHADFLRGVAENPGRLNQRDMWSVLSVNLVAGSDTTAMSLRAVFYYLTRNPWTYKKLQDEIDTADAAGIFSRLVSFKQGSSLLYLQAVLKEAMRLHPGVSYLMERVVPEGGMKLGDNYVPEGTIVGMHAWVLHRDPNVFDDPEAFRPERWLDSNPEKLKQMEQTLLTFGYGSRTCIGKHISMLEMTKLVPQILRHFEVEWAETGLDWTISAYWFARQSGMIMKLRCRQDEKMGARV